MLAAKSFNDNKPFNSFVMFFENKQHCCRYFELLIHEDSDVALVRIFECFLEAAPQKILQISIILSGEEKISGK